MDLVVSLHACDVATDFALAQAVRWGARVILAVPCCQHEIFTQLQKGTQSVLLQHGILKERTAALLTDAARESFWRCRAMLYRSWSSLTWSTRPRTC